MNTQPQTRRIDLSDLEIKAILAGKKTQVRRALTNQPPHEGKLIGPVEFLSIAEKKGEEVEGPVVFGVYDEYGEWGARCPFGKPGDRLWVKEKFAIVAKRWVGGEYETHVVKGPLPKIKPSNYDIHYSDSQDHSGPWRPAAQMLRWASRMELEVANIRVERVQNISESDALAEGLSEGCKDGVLKKYGQSEWPWQDWEKDPRRAYRFLWDQINKKDPATFWASNPLVWVVDFRRVN
jgi:hypothetical protein